MIFDKISKWNKVFERKICLIFFPKIDFTLRKIAYQYHICMQKLRNLLGSKIHIYTYQTKKVLNIEDSKTYFSIRHNVLNTSILESYSNLSKCQKSMFIHIYCFGYISRSMWINCNHWIKKLHFNNRNIWTHFCFTIEFIIELVAKIKHTSNEFS